MCQGDVRINLVPEFIADEAIQVYLNAADIFVLPYKDITTSGAAFLALSFGRPIIAPSIASFPEVVTPQSGILYDPQKTNSLVSALQEAKKHFWSETEILAYAHQFDWDKLGKQLSTIYYKQERNRKYKLSVIIQFYHNICCNKVKLSEPNTMIQP